VQTRPNWKGQSACNLHQPSVETLFLNVVGRGRGGLFKGFGRKGGDSMSLSSASTASAVRRKRRRSSASNPEERGPPNGLEILEKKEGAYENIGDHLLHTGQTITNAQNGNWAQEREKEGREPFQKEEPEPNGPRTIPAIRVGVEGRAEQDILSRA